MTRRTQRPAPIALRIAAAAAVSTPLALVANSSPALAFDCDGTTSSSHTTRTKAISHWVTSTMTDEGYHNNSEWDTVSYPIGGVCYFNNDDGGGPNNPPDWFDGFGDPVWLYHDRLEGLDCSGLIGKGWMMQPDFADNGTFRTWGENNVYRNWSSHSWTGTADNATWKDAGYGNEIYMDLMAKNGHVVMVIQPRSSGKVDSLEAMGHWGLAGASVKETGAYFNRSVPSSDGYVTRARKGWS